MKRIKIIKKNRKSQFMLIAIMLFSLAYLTFGLLMLFSPLINYVDNNGESIFILLRNFFTNELGYNNFNTFLTEFPDREWSYNSWLPFILSSSDTNEIAFLPSSITLIWIPLIVGGASFFVILTRYIIHIIGYKSINKAGTAKIIRPIRSYQLTLTLTWFFFVILSITAFLTYISSSIFWIGGFFSLNYGEGQLLIIVGDTTSEFYNFEAFLIETGMHNSFYWLSMLLFNNWFNNHGQYYVDIGTVPSTNDSVSYFIITLWFLIPALPLLLFWINSFIGSIVGSCSWGTINSIVLEAINFKKESTDDTSENKQNSDNKKIKNKEKDSHQEREKCLKFYKNLKLMTELSETTWSSLYIKANEKINELNSDEEIKKINWQDEVRIIDEIIADFFEKDKKFILLLEKIISSSQNVITNSQKKVFKKLIENYNIHYEEQKIIEMETTIEEIYLNSFEFEELYGKIGYCIKNKLIKKFNKINDELEVIDRLNFAKDNEDYDEYRGVCLEAIIKISPNKQKISSLIREMFE